MDNITHSLIGIAAAESAFHWRYRGDKPRKFTHAGRALRGALWLASFLASNFPDLDFLYQRITPGKVGALLHHRGHTHTLSLGVLEGLIVAAIVWLFVRIKKDDFLLGARDWIWISAISVLGIGLHIGADFWNSYGVHPFWPWDSRWYYGDFIFIMEPWLWMTLIPAIYFATNRQTKRGKAARGLLLTIFVLALGLVWFSGYVPKLLAFGVTLWGLLLFKLMKKWTPSRRMIEAGSALIGFLLIFLAVSSLTKKTITARLQVAHTEIHDIILSPLPANPFCWFFVSVETFNGNYISRTGIQAAYPALYSAKSCPRLRGETGTSTAPLAKSLEPDDESTVWLGDFKAPLEEFKMIATNCYAAAFLQFARAPYWVMQAPTWIVGALRFDREKGLGFAEFRLPEALTPCPGNLPPWTAPRRDVLSM